MLIPRLTLPVGQKVEPGHRLAPSPIPLPLSLCAEVLRWLEVDACVSVIRKLFFHCDQFLKRPRHSFHCHLIQNFPPWVSML